ncbi:MAG: hypothetical protein ACLU3F_17105 [Blautia wexlerae]
MEMGDREQGRVCEFFEKNKLIYSTARELAAVSSDFLHVVSLMMANG